MQYTAGEVRVSSNLIYSRGPLHTDEQGKGDQLEPIFNSSVLIQDVAWETCRKQWTIGTSGGRGSEKSMPVARHDIQSGQLNYSNFEYLNIPGKELNVTDIEPTSSYFVMVPISNERKTGIVRKGR